MTDADATPLQTPLTSRHEALGARLIEFGGWLMPVQYSGILEEHRAVRERVGCSTSRTWASCSSTARPPARPWRRPWSPIRRRSRSGGPTTR